jgi:autotransporter-associated beta strand protein
MSITRPTILAAALVLIACQGISMGQIITIGTNGPNTTDTNNYSGGVSLVKVGTNTVTLTGNNTYTGATMVSNGVLQAGIAGAFSTNSTYTLNGGTIDLNATAQSIHMVQMLSGTNTQVNGSLTTLRPFFEAIMLAPNADNSGTYNLQGGYLGTTNLGNLQVGYRGTGVLNQSGGTNNISGYFVIGRFSPGGNGTYNLTGGLALQSSSNRVSFIGEDGTGVMNVSGTGVYSNAGKIIIASTANANGTLSISNGGVVTAPGIDFGAGTGRVIFDRSDAYSAIIPMNGQGSVIKNGSGTVTFAVNNGYTRGTTVNQGALIVKGLANNANNTVTVNNGGTFVFAVNNTFGNHSANVITPIVINSGGLVTNEPTVNALGPITFNGGTLAAGGMVSGYSYLLKGGVTVNSNSTISGPGIALGSAAVTGTAFTVSGGATLTVDSGLINGPSPTWPRSQASYLIKDGLGTLLLNGTNTYTGDTTISNGVLWVNGSGVLNNGNYDGEISMATNGTLIIGTTANQSIGGIISGAGSLVKTNSGTLTITGPDNSYTGTTTIGQGTLVLNGTHTNGGRYTVQTGGTLRGEGRTTSAVTVAAGGNITPGNGGLGELTIGSLTLNGTLNIFLDGAHNSLLTVVGNAALTGGGVNFSTNAALTEDVYVFLSASGGLTGTLSSSNTPSGYDLIYDTNDGVAFLKLSSVTNVVEAIFNGPNAVIGNGATNFNVYVYNGSTNTAITNFTASGMTTNGSVTTRSVSTNNIAPESGVELASMTFSNSGTSFGTNTGAFNYVLNGASNQATFDVVVYDHASNVVTGTNLSFGAVHRGAATASSTNSVTVSNSTNGFRIALGVTNNNTNSYLTIDTAGGLAQGESADLFGQLDLSRVSLGYFTNTVQLIAYDDSDLSGASTNVGTTDVTITGYVYSGQGVWTSTNGGNWSDFASWQVDGGTPGLDGALSVADTATFGTNGSGSVTLNTNASLLAVTFSNATSSYTLGGEGTLTLASYGGTNASVATVAGSHTITAPVELSSAVVLSNSIGSALTISGNITGNSSLVKSGAGTTTLTGRNGYVGTTTITGGTLAVTNGAIGSGAVTVSGGVLSPIGPEALNIASDLTFGASGAYLWTLYNNTNSGPGVNFTAPTEVAGKLSVATNAHFQMFFTSAVDATNDFWDANDYLTNTWVVMTGSDLAEGVNFRASFAPGSTTNGFDANNFFFTVSGGNLLLNFTPGLIVFPGPDEFRPGDNNYPWVVYQPGGELDIPVGVNVVIKAAVTMNNNSTTIIIVIIITAAFFVDSDDF